MELQEDCVSDRRIYDRVPIRFAVEWSDHSSLWRGQCLNFSAGGLYVIGGKPLVPGRKLQVRLLPKGENPLELRGKVAFQRTEGMGLCLDVRAPEEYERTQELFERIVARDFLLAVSLRKKKRELSSRFTLYPTPASLLANACVNEGERRILACLGPERSVSDLERDLGQEWFAHVPSLFGLLEREIVTLDRRRAATREQVSQVSSVRFAKQTEPAVPRGPRSAQAERYFQQGQADLKAGSRHAAITNFKLALMLAPGDAQILQAIEKLDLRGIRRPLG